jgi:hypothetical protein
MNDAHVDGNDEIKSEADTVAVKGKAIAQDFDLHNKYLIRNYFAEFKAVKQSLTKRLSQPQITQAKQGTQSFSYPPADDPWWDTCAP